MTLRTLLALGVAALGLGACTPVGTAVGAGAVVAQSVIQDRSTFDAVEDTRIQIALMNALANHSGELFRDVSADVVEGRVTLTGSVPEREDKVAATEIAWTISGVRSVEDATTVAEDAGTLAYLTDVRISNALRWELLTDLDVKSVNYNVETVERTVHLTGLARSDAELRRVINHARRIDGVTAVVSHILTIDDPRRQFARDLPQNQPANAQPNRPAVETTAAPVPPAQALAPAAVYAPAPSAPVETTALPDPV